VAKAGGFLLAVWSQR